MFLTTTLLLANFSSPESIGTNPKSILCMLPLLAAIVVIYKTTKLQSITASSFLKETVSLFLSIMVFIFVTALVLHAIAYLISV